MHDTRRAVYIVMADADQMQGCDGAVYQEVITRKREDDSQGIWKNDQAGWSYKME